MSLNAIMASSIKDSKTAWPAGAMHGIGHNSDAQDDAALEDINYSALLRRVGQDRDKEAFIALFDHFAPRVKSFLMRGGLPDDLADELAQDTMLTLWHKAERYDPTKAAASTWIFTIARNKKIDHLRKGKTNAIELDERLPLVDDAPNQDDLYAREEEARALGKAIAELPAEQADMLRQSFFEQKPHSQIAKDSGLPLGTVKSRIRQALKKLQSMASVRSLR